MLVAFFAGIFGWTRTRLSFKDFGILLALAIGLAGFGAIMIQSSDNPLHTPEDRAIALTIPSLVYNASVKFFTLAIPFLIGFAARKVRDRRAIAK